MRSSNPTRDALQMMDAVLAGLARLAQALRLPAGPCAAAAARAFPQAAAPQRLADQAADETPEPPAELSPVVLTALEDLIDTLVHNVSRRDGDVPYFQRCVYSTRILEGATAEARARIQERATAFTEVLDDDLSQVELQERGEQAGTRRLGAGVFYFETPERPAES